MRKIKAKWFGPSESAQMMRVIKRVALSGDPVVVLDDRGGTGAWKVQVEYEGDADPGAVIRGGWMVEQASSMMPV